MGIMKKVTQVMNGINEIGTKKIAPKIGKVLNKGVEKAPGVIDKTAEVLDKTIKKTQSFVGKVKSGEVSEGIGKVARNILTDDSSYTTKVGNIALSNKFLVADELNSRAKSIGDKGAAIFDTISKDKIKGVWNPIQLLKKSDDSLVGWKTNFRGKMVIGAGAVIAGTPAAAKSFVQNRQGQNYDNQAVTPAPRLPAYQQNGGATGDLVFALNNLRHGGMM